MGASKVLDAYIAYQFVKILSTPWEKTDAFKLGIIDKDGNLLKKSRELTTSDEKKAYTMIHRLIWNIKRLLDKLPTGKTRITSFTTALWMLKEHTEIAYGCSFDVPQNALREYIFEEHDINITNLLTEARDSGVLRRGKYVLRRNVDAGAGRSRAGDTITIKKDIKTPDSTFAGQSLFLVTVDRTKQTVMVSLDDLKEKK